MAQITVPPELIDLEAPPVMRALIRHLLERAHVVARDPHGRTILRFDLAVEPRLMDKLAPFSTSDDDQEDADE